MGLKERRHCKGCRLLQYDRGGEQLLGLLEDFNGVPLAASFLAKTCEKRKFGAGDIIKAVVFCSMTAGRESVGMRL